MTKIFKLISLLYLIINCMSIAIADENFFNKGLKLFKDKNMRMQGLCLKEE